jgi:hypothetical protein
MLLLSGYESLISFDVTEDEFQAKMGKMPSGRHSVNFDKLT